MFAKGGRSAVTCAVTVRDVEGLLALRTNEREKTQ
jgi:hypothetical protein